MHKFIASVKETLRRFIVFIRQHSLLIPSLVSFLSFMVAVLLIISVWGTHNVTSALETTLYENASFSAAKAAGLMDATFQDIIDTAAHLETINALSPRSYREDSYNSYKTLRLFNSAKFSDIVLCYKDTPRLLTIYGTCYPDVYFAETHVPETLISAIHDMTSVGFISTSAYGAPWDKSRLLMCYPLNTQCTAVFVLNSSRINSIISPAIGTSESIQVLYDINDSILWSNQPINDDTKRLLLAGAGGSNKLSLNGSDYILSVNSVGYNAHLIVLDKITTQFDSLHITLTMLIAICIVIVILGILLLAYSVRRGYKPIANLVLELRTVLPQQQDSASSDIATLRNACSQYGNLLQASQQNAALFTPEQLRSLFVLRTISGRNTDAKEFDTLCRWLQIDCPHQYFFACLLLFDGVAGDQERRDIEECLYHDAHAGYFSCFYLQPDGRSAVGIINVPTDDPSQLMNFGDQMLASLPSSLRATLGMGQIYSGTSNLGKSYLEAHAALDYRLIKGKNTWISYSEISIPDTAPSYPHNLLNSYISAVRTWDVQGIRDILQQITNYIYSNNLPLQQVKCICFDLTSAFLREISALDTHVSYKPSMTFDVFNIAEYDSVSELAQKIVSFSENVQQYINKQNEYQASNLVLQCEEYIRQNVSNPQFSLSSCAEQFDVSPQTLRRKFKEATGQTLSSYLTAVRVERAKELLLTTDADINEISISCGYLDLSSFIRLFKSETGVSPGKFREMHDMPFHTPD